MTLSGNLVQKFSEAKSGNFDAINYFVNYFMNNAEKQLQNLNFNQTEKNEKINKCHQVILMNIRFCYDVNNFINQTLENIKNIIYLNQLNEVTGSKDIVTEQKDIIGAKLSVSNLDFMNISVKDRELARLYYLENKDVDELAEMFKCSKTIIYVKLRRVANALMTKKVSNSVSNNETFIYRK